MMQRNRDNSIDLQFTNEPSVKPCGPRALTAGVPAEPASAVAAEKIPPSSSAALIEKKAPVHDFRTTSEEKLSHLVGGAAVPEPLALLDKAVPEAIVAETPHGKVMWKKRIRRNNWNLAKNF